MIVGRDWVFSARVGVVFRLPDRRMSSSLVMPLPRPMQLRCTDFFHMALSIMFYHAILFSWLRILRLRFCASISPLVFYSQLGSVGSISAGFTRSRFLISIQSMARTAIFIMAAHLDNSSGGSSDSFFQNGEILNRLLHITGCVMSYLCA